MCHRSGPRNGEKKQNKTKNLYEVGTVKKLLVIIKKSTNNKRWRGHGEKRAFQHCWWKCKLMQPLWKTVWRILKQLKIELPYDMEIPLLGIYPEKTIIRKDTFTPMSTAAHL
uniref:Uncharacterized protein n=1 Tax=Sus scrofa TaxID=9823 RepID=A0A8D0SX81_PIG